MKEVTIKIPDNKFGFFMELIEQLDFEVAGEVEIPEERYGKRMESGRKESNPQHLDLNIQKKCQNTF